MNRRSRVLWRTVPFVIGIALYTAFDHVLSGMPGSEKIHGPEQRPMDPETGCGPVALAVLTRALGQPRSITECNKASQAGVTGMSSFGDLLQALHRFGIPAEAVDFGQNTPIRLSKPAILFVDAGHFLVAYPSPTGRVIIIDPPNPPSLTTWEEVRKRWLGEAIVIKETGEVAESTKLGEAP